MTTPPDLTADHPVAADDMVTLLRRIRIDPTICGGEPQIHRLTVYTIVQAVAAGDSPEDVAISYDVPLDDIRAALLFVDLFAPDWQQHGGLTGFHWIEAAGAKMELDRRAVLHEAAVEVLGSRMSGICGRSYAAGWLGGLEFDLWTILQGGDPGDYAILDGDLAELRHLSDAIDGWVRWDADAGRQFVARADWDALYAAHCEAHPGI